MLTHLSLFTGIGGIDLASEWAGFTTVGQVEMADYPTKVLEKHWPDVPKWRDVRDVTADSFRERTGLSTVSLVSGGYPCQPFSMAGKRRGEADDRYLWPEMFRVIRELRPTWVLGENVAGHVTLVLDDTLSDLAGAGYTARAFLFPALAIGANHVRERVFIVAYASGKGLQRGENRRFPRVGRPQLKKQLAGFPALEDWDAISAGYTRRTDDGLRNRMDRLKALGNAVVPQQVYPILKAIADIEKSKFV